MKMKIIIITLSCSKKNAGWKLEYNGYLMAGHHGHTAGSTYTCVDEHPDTVPGCHANTDGYLYYTVEARCGTLK